MKVIFDHSDGRKSVLGEATNKQDAWKIVKKFLDEHDYHSPYQRITFNPEKRSVWMDFGSWVQFIEYTDMTDEEMEEWKI